MAELFLISIFISFSVSISIENAPEEKSQSRQTCDVQTMVPFMNTTIEKILKPLSLHLNLPATCSRRPGRVERQKEKLHNLPLLIQLYNVAKLQQAIRSTLSSVPTNDMGPKFTSIRAPLESLASASQIIRECLCERIRVLRYTPARATALNRMCGPAAGRTYINGGGRSGNHSLKRSMNDLLCEIDRFVALFK